MHIEFFIRSINLYKFTDGEYKDRYVDIYLWMNDVFKDLEKLESRRYLNSIIYGVGNKILLEVSTNGSWNWLNSEIYNTLKYKYINIDSKDIIRLFQYYISTILNINIGTILEICQMHSLRY